MTTTDPLDPKIDKWLRSTEPRQELVVRFAMRLRYPKVRANRDFSNRIDDLRRVLGLVDDPDRLAMIIADARMVEDKIEELIDGNPLR